MDYRCFVANATVKRCPTTSRITRPRPSIFAVAVLASLSFSMREAILIFALFITQFAIPIPEVRVGFGVMYIALALIWFISERRDLPVLMRHARATIRGVEAGGEERRQL